MRRSPWRFLWISPDIRNRLLFTGLILVIYRFAAHVPVPNVNREALLQLFGAQGAVPLFSLLDLLSGGTVANFSILAMGVYPYITAQIILQLLVPIVPALQRMSEEDPRQARKWMERWTFILAVPMAALNAVGQIQLFQQFATSPILNVPFGANLTTFTMVVSMTAGTMFAIWLGNLISEFGLRNQGLSIIIFSGIVARMPANFGRILADESSRLALLAVLIVVTLGTIVAIVFVQEGRRNVPVMYPGRRMGNRMSMPVKGTLPLMVNMAGMIPLIFAQSLITLPALLAQFFIDSQYEVLRNIAVWIQATFGGGSSAYWLLYFIFVVGFT
ncbi:MAG: preprotein translocase subunit SecY, partial [Anaerolineales bacterium]|nr:preprotein translocase subunit SecY [Anaerolineales bacterium]